MKNNERTHMCVTILTPEFFPPFNSHLVGPDTLPWVEMQSEDRVCSSPNRASCLGEGTASKSDDTIQPLQIVIELSRKRRMSFENEGRDQGKFFF